jgi:hypothetical protein
VVRAAGARILSGPARSDRRPPRRALDGQHLAGDSRPGLGLADTISGATELDCDEAVVTTDDDVESVDGLQSNAIEFDTSERDETDEETRRPSENTPRNDRRGLRHF